MNAIIQSYTESINIYCNFFYLHGSDLHTRTMQGIAPQFIKASAAALYGVLPSLCDHFMQREAPSPEEIERAENRAKSSFFFCATRGSRTNRTASSRSSGEYLFECSMCPVSQGLGPPGDPARFRSDWPVFPAQDDPDFGGVRAREQRRSIFALSNESQRVLSEMSFRSSSSHPISVTSYGWESPDGYHALCST